MIAVNFKISASGRVHVRLFMVDNARMIITTPSQKMLVVGDRCYNKDGLVYNIPGGHVSQYDKSIEGTAHRELFEETYDHAKRHPYPIIGDLELVDRYFVKHVKMNIVVFWYHMSSEPTTLRAEISNPEVSVYEWVPVKDLVDAFSRVTRVFGPSKRISLMGKKSIAQFIANVK